MSEITLMINPSDVVALTTINGNIDEDSLKPLIFIAQTTYLKSFLGLKFYNKIYEDFVSDSLDGNYLKVFNEYIKDLLSYKTSTLYIEFGGYKVAENGIHKISSNNMQPLEESELTTLALRYNKLVANVESNFKEFVEPLNLPELKNLTIDINDDMPWH